MYNFADRTLYQLNKIIICRQICSNRGSKREQHGRYGSEPTFWLHSGQRFATEFRTIITCKTRGN